MDLRKLDPTTLEISDMNERVGETLTDDLADSVRKQGVVQPPLVRVTDKGGEDGGTFEVVVGQRRTLAAQKAGLDELPVVVVNWDDAEALEASITENIDTFVDEVSDTDRAAAVERLMELHDESQRTVAQRLGVDPKTIRRWLEGTRDEWEGTDVEPGYRRRKRQGDGVGRDAPQEADVYSGAAEEAGELADKVGGSTLNSIRAATGGGEEGEEMAHRVANDELNQKDVRDIARSVKDGATVEEATERVESEEIGVQLTLPESTGSKLKERAEADGVSEEEIVRRAVDRYLSED